MNKDFDLYWSYYSEKIVSSETPIIDRISNFENNFKNFIESI
jgi:hypothetical protein